MDNTQANACCDNDSIFSASALDDIKKLIQSNEDTAKGFGKAEEVIDNPGYRKLFSDIASDRKQFAVRLRAEVSEYCADANFTELPSEASASARVEQWWMKLKANLSSDELVSILCSAEEAEDKIKENYERVLSEQKVPAPITTLIREQYQTIKQQHDKVRDLRDILKAH